MKNSPFIWSPSQALCIPDLQLCLFPVSGPIDVPRTFIAAFFKEGFSPSEIREFVAERPQCPVLELGGIGPSSGSAIY